MKPSEVQEMVGRMQAQAAFSPNATPNHIHNGIDSPKLTYSNIINTPKTYAGSVGSTGAAILLPSGWTSVGNSTGDYTVTHNLGTANYGIGATITTNDLSNFRAIISVAAADKSSFTILTGSAAAGSGVAVGFTFVLFVQK